MSIPDSTCSCSFSASRLAKVAAMEQGHFWFAARRRLVTDRVDRWLPPDAGLVADLGCGTGSLVADLARGGRRMIGMDRRTEGVRSTAARSLSGRYAQADIERLPVRGGALAGALLLDTLEHVDDALALREVRRALRSDGVVIVTVPAIPRLWSRRDEEAGHRRRYTRTTLRVLLEQGGFDVLEMDFYQCLLLPVIALSRWLGRDSIRWRDAEDNVPRRLNAALKAVSSLEVQVGRTLRWPIGSSLVAVAAKRSST